MILVSYNLYQTNYIVNTFFDIFKKNYKQRLSKNHIPRAHAYTHLEYIKKMVKN